MISRKNSPRPKNGISSDIKNLPTISIITCTYNCDLKLFEKVLKAIQVQNYPKKLIEHLILDGGSTNNINKLAKKYGCHLIVRKDLKEAEQMRASLGFEIAKGKILLMLQSDNIVVSKDWIMQMVAPFREEENIYFTYSDKNNYFKGMNLLTRYCALFGANDPTIYYLKKTEKIRMDEDKYNKGKILSENDNYYVVRFNKSNLPTLGDNGQMFLRSAIRKVTGNHVGYMHTDAIAQLLDLGYDTFGVVKNSVIHVQKNDILKSVSRRVEIKEKFYDKYRGKRKYLVYNAKSPEDRLNLIKYIIYSVTFIIPLAESIRGYLKIKDTAWFLHPVICFLMVAEFSYSELRRTVKNLQ